jgi:signal transduction histidine kinase
VHRLTAHESGPSTSAPPNSNVPGIAHDAGLAHDAGNLLGALGLYCDLLRVPGVLRPEHRHYATELGLISSRSSDLIRRLLALSPTPTPPSPIDPPVSNPDAFRLQPADVRRGGPRLTETPRPGLTQAAVLRNLAPVLERIAAGAATVSVSAPASLPPHDLPAEALERITVNLVRNAVEAIRGHHASPAPSAPHGTIRVALGIVAGRLQLTVEDNGPGIPPPIAAAFLRPTATQPSSGRGLGHRIVHELVTSSGGQISIRTRPGNGTSFCLKWPLAAPATYGPESATGATRTTLSTGPSTVATPRPDSLPATQKGLPSC